MSNHKTILNKKVAAGAALVALSGFVPQPMMQSAHAASASINVSGSFVTGVSLAAGVAANFGKLVGTAATGNVTLKETGAITATVGAKKVGALSTNGTFKATIVNTTVPLNVTIKGLGKVTLNNTINGAVAAGTVTLSKLLIGGAALTAQKVVTVGGGTTGKTTVKAATTAANAIVAVGGRVEWTGGVPIGQFTQAVTLIAAF